MKSSVEFEALIAVTTRSSVFCDIMPRSLVKPNWCFEGTIHLHLQGKRIGQARNQYEAEGKQNFIC
jgi:hypothetical protein